MRPIREITAEEENFRVEAIAGFSVVRRDSIKPEPEGTIILKAFRVTGYDRDCDGGLMARLENIDSKCASTGWEENCIGMDSTSGLVVTEEEWRSLFGSVVS